MRKLIVSEWMSLDGICDSSTMEHWFNPYHSDSRARYIQETIQHCDIMLYGRITYEMLYPYWSSFKDNAMGVADKLNKGKKYVVSTSLTNANWENTNIIKNNVTEAITALKKEKGGDILVQGSTRLVQTLLKAGLVDELKLLVNPFISGSGKRLFEEQLHTGLKLDQVQQLDKGVLVICYTPEK